MNKQASATASPAYLEVLGAEKELADPPPTLELQPSIYSLVAKRPCRYTLAFNPIIDCRDSLRRFPYLSSN
jgi:hypothetical protein